MPGVQEKNIGLIGLGYWGKNILRSLYELGSLHTACDSDASTVLENKSEYKNVNYTTNYNDILDNAEIKSVAIAAPAAMHYKLTKESLLSGKDVLVEKPLALTSQEGKELIAIAEDNKRILMVGHILQYHPAVIKLKALVSLGELGKIQYIYSNRLNIGKFRVEEDIIWSFAPHDVSVILMLLDEEPVKISAFGGDYLNRGIWDTTLTNLTFGNGVKGHIFVSWLHPFKEQKLVVVGSKAMAVFDDTTEQKLCIYPHTVEWLEGKIPVAHKAECRAINCENKEPLKEELKHFINCVNTRARSKTDGHEALRVLRVLEKAEEFLRKE